MKQAQENRKKAMEWWRSLEETNIAFVIAACGKEDRNTDSFTGREIEEMYNKMHEPITLNRAKFGGNIVTYTEDEVKEKIIEFVNWLGEAKKEIDRPDQEDVDDFMYYLKNKKLL